MRIHQVCIRTLHSFHLRIATRRVFNFVALVAFINKSKRIFIIPIIFFSFYDCVAILKKSMEKILNILSAGTTSITFNVCKSSHGCCTICIANPACASHKTNLITSNNSLKPRACFCFQYFWYVIFFCAVWHVSWIVCDHAYIRSVALLCRPSQCLIESSPSMVIK